MVNIDTVYQRVLALANKEQRGYITPLEFNLIANQASLDIFEQYFYDVNQNERLPGNDRQYSDIEHILNEKIAPFEIPHATLPNLNNLPADLYMIGQVIVQDVNGKRYICEEVTTKELIMLDQSPLNRPNIKRSVYIKFLSNASPVGYGIRVVGPDPGTFNIRLGYIKMPNRVEWGYDVINEMALYQPATSTHFEHHPSDEVTLVNKILESAGIIINKPGLANIASQKDLQKTQQQKA